MIGLIAIDLDGTLLDSQGRVPDANRTAIWDAAGRGIHVALVTGRTYTSARPLADGLPDSVSLIVSNGAVERGMDGALRARRLLDRRVAHVVLDRTRIYRSSAALVFDRDTERQFVYETMDFSHVRRKTYWERRQHLLARSVPLEDALTEDPIQVTFNGGVAAMRELVDALRRDADAYSVAVTEYAEGDFSLIDITAPEATKAQALRWLAAERGLTRDEVMAIGDNFNDLEMLESVGMPVVMANSVSPLKERGWHITGHQNDAGVAQAIRHIVLPSGPRSPIPDP